MPAKPRTQKYLGIYLADHRAAAQAGLALARRFRDANTQDTPLASTLERLVDDIEADRDALDRLIERLDCSPRRIKSALVAVAELLGRLKRNGRLLRRSPLSQLEEFELLSTGLAAKRSLWESLAAVADDQHLPVGEMNTLAQRAEEQRRALEAHHVTVAAQALAA